MLSRRQVLQSLGASAAGALAPSRRGPCRPAIGSAANRAQIVDFDFDVTPYLTQLKNAGVKTIGRYYDRAYGTGIGEVCYHHKSKTLTKAELTAIERAGMSVYVIFQHCNHSCANFDLANPATADKGRKDADRRGAAGARSRTARGHADLFRRRFRSVSRQGLRDAGRAHLAERRAVFQSDQRGLRADALAGRHLRRGRDMQAPEGERQGQVLLAVDVARPCRLAGVLQRRRVASVSERHRDQAHLRARHDRHRRRQSGAALFWRSGRRTGRRRGTIPRWRRRSSPAAPSSRRAASSWRRPIRKRARRCARRSRRRAAS